MIFQLPVTGSAHGSVAKKTGSMVTGQTTVQQPMIYDFGTVDFSGALEATLPKTAQQKNSLYRKIYQFDSVSGSTIDLMAMLPFSDYSLAGVSDPAVLQVFEDSLDQLNVETLVQQIAVEYLTIGYLVGTLVFNDELGIFTDVIIQDPDYCDIVPIPLYGRDPKIDLRVPAEIRKFLTSRDNRDIQARGELSSKTVRKLLSGKIKLDPVTTLYLARRMSLRDVGTSYLSRVVPFYVLEQALLKGTISSALRRQRAIMHIQVGSDEWEPTESQLEEIIELFLAADSDPVGAVVATRRDVDVTEVKSGGDFWKVTDELDTLNAAKMRALGINEAFLSGDAIYSTMEVALSVFLESLRTFRSYVTNKMFYSNIFPTLARAHRFIKRKQSELDHRIRITGTSEDIPKKDLIIPIFQWHKQLQPQYDQNYLDILTTLEEKGIPVPIRVWAAAGGYSVDQLLETLDDDKEVRRTIADWKKEIKEFAGEEEEGAFGGSGYTPIRDRRRIRNLEMIVEGMKKAEKGDPKKVKKLLEVAKKVSPDKLIEGPKMLVGNF